MEECRVGRRVSVSSLICVTVEVLSRTVCRLCNFLWFTIRVARFHATTTSRVLPLWVALPLSSEERWRMFGIRRTRKAKASRATTFGGNENGQLVKNCTCLHVRPKETAGSRTLRGGDKVDKLCAVKQEEDHEHKEIQVHLPFLDHVGAKECAITWMLVGNS